MISLLLTLFISMLSIGSSINSIEENSESRISTISNDSLNLSDSINNKSLVQYSNYYLVSSGDFVFDDLYQSIVEKISSEFSISNEHDYTYSWNVSSGNVQIKVRTNQTNNNISSAFNSTYDVTSISIVKHYVSSSEIGYGFNFYYLDGSTSKYLQLDYLVSFNFLYNGEPVSDKAVVNRTILITNNTTYEFWPYNYYLNIFRYGDLSSEIFVEPILNKSSNYDTGYNDGFAVGYNTGENAGYQSGYNQAIQDYDDYDSTALTIFSGIMGIALVPINMFLQIFNFEILGINVSGFISGILTVAVVVIIIRMITGGKKDD